MGFFDIIEVWEGFQTKFYLGSLQQIRLQLEFQYGDFHFDFHFAHFRVWKVPVKFHKKANLRLNKAKKKSGPGPLFSAIKPYVTWVCGII